MQVTWHHSLLQVKPSSCSAGDREWRACWEHDCGLSGLSVRWRQESWWGPGQWELGDVEGTDDKVPRSDATALLP